MSDLERSYPEDEGQSPKSTSERLHDLDLNDTQQEDGDSELGSLFGEGQLDVSDSGSGNERASHISEDVDERRSSDLSAEKEPLDDETTIQFPGEESQNSSSPRRATSKKGYAEWRKDYQDAITETRAFRQRRADQFTQRLTGIWQAFWNPVRHVLWAFWRFFCNALVFVWNRLARSGPVEIAWTLLGLFIIYHVLHGFFKFGKGFIQDSRQAIYIPTTESCTLHSEGAIQFPGPVHNGFIPPRYQAKINEAALHLPRQLQEWVDVGYFDIGQSLLNGTTEGTAPVAEAINATVSVLPRVLAREVGESLDIAVADLTSVSKEMIRCFGEQGIRFINATVKGNVTKRLLQDPNMSRVCKAHILLKEDTMRSLAIVLANTENVVDYSNWALKHIPALRKQYVTAKATIKELELHLENHTQAWDSLYIHRELSAFRDSPLHVPFNGDVSRKDTHMSNWAANDYNFIQQRNLHLLWLDMIISTLDRILAEREEDLTLIIDLVSHWEEQEILASVKHAISTNPRKTASNGIADLLAYRTAAVLGHLRRVMRPVGKEAFQAAAIRWMKGHSVPDHWCTCGKKEAKLAWKVWFAGDKERERQARRLLQWYYWGQEGSKANWARAVPAPIPRVLLDWYLEE